MSTQEKKSNRSPLMRWFLAFAPGLVTAAIVFGPSKITITSKMGAMYGYDLLWVIALAIFFMVVFTGIASRIALATDQSLLCTIRDRFGNAGSSMIGVGIFLVATSFQAGNSVGVGIAVGEATDTSPTAWVVLFNLVGFILLFFRDFYKTLERLMIAIVGLMLFAFLTTMFLAQPDIAGVLRGISFPSMPDGSLGLVIAFFASSFSIVGAFYQSYLVQARKRISPDLRQDGKNSLVGMVVLGLMSAVVMICAATVLQPQGIAVDKASDMAMALEPLFGNYAARLFLVGLFGASFSSLVGNATIGGSLLADGLGFGSLLDSRVVKTFIALVMIVGGLIAIGFERPPLEIIVFAQSVTIFLVPFIGLFMYLISCDKQIMGNYVNRGFSKVAGLIGLILLVLLAGYNVNELFIK